MRKDPFYGVDRDGEADARIAAAGAQDRGIDPDEPTGRVQQRAAGVAGIDEGAGLEEVLEDGAAQQGNRSKLVWC